MSSSGWHQLPREASESNEQDDEEEAEDDEEDEEADDYSTEEGADDGDEGDSDGDEQDDSSYVDGVENRAGEHRIDIGERVDSFWDDDENENAHHHLRRPHHEEDLSIIDVLAQEMQQQEIPSYLEQFEIVVPDAELVVGAVPLEDIQQREREIEEAKIREKQLEVELFRQRETRLAQRAAQAREELRSETERKQKQLLQQKRQLAQAVQLQSQRLGHVFQQAESHLKSVLRRQQARVSEVFGRLEPSNIPAERRRYRVEWDQIPVTMKFRVKMLRALKDKLPRGQYVLLATLYDRLGGHALHWTAWDPEEKPHPHRRGRRRRPSSSNSPLAPLLDPAGGVASPDANNSERTDRPNVTRPFRHRGRFFSTDVSVNQDVFVVCPPQSQLRPGNVIVFELFLLETSTVRPRKRGGGHQIHDQIVAWGAMPLMTPEFAYVEGKLKIPFLKGEMDATMDKYRDIEDMYTRDLSAWLCNLYLQVTPMKDEMERLILGRIDREERDADQSYDIEIDQRNAVYRFGSDSVDTELPENLRIRKKSHIVSPDEDTKPIESTGPSTSATQLTDDGDGEFKKGKLDRHSTGLLGFWSAAPMRKKKSNRVYAEEDEDEDEANGVLDTENYRFSVNSSFARESAHHVRFHATRKLHYLRHELFIDMGLSRHALRKMEFWLLLLMLCFALWLRIYVHYVAQWVFLKAQHVAVFFFRPQWTTCMIKYTWRSVATHTEIGVILAGVLGNWSFFAFLASAAAVSQTHVGELPAFGSKFIVCVGIATLLDPFLVLLVDIGNHQYDCVSRSDCAVSLSSPSCKCVDGDAFKLYTRFLAQEGSGLVGIAITAIIYAALTSLSLVAFYMYLLHVHMNGRMLDVYRRIHAQEAELFIPHDCEVPLQELKAICEQATRWKGPRGTQRKVFVHEYVLEDPLDPAFQEKSTHIALYTVGLDGANGARELYRHFLKSPDGAIIELFGQVDASADGRRAGAWQRDAAPGVVSSLALLHNILQDHQRVTPPPEAPESELAKVLNGRQ